MAAPARLAPGFPGGGKSAREAEREDRAGCTSGEPRRKPRRAGGHALTSTHCSQGEPEQQQQRLHAEPQIHAATRSAAALQELESGQRGRAPGRKERREPGLARVGTELAWLPDRGRVSAPAAPLAAGPTPARCLCSAGAASSAAAKLALVAPGRRQKLSKWLTLLCSVRDSKRPFGLGC